MKRRILILIVVIITFLLLITSLVFLRNRSVRERKTEITTESEAKNATTQVVKEIENISSLVSELEKLI